MATPDGIWRIISALEYSTLAGGMPTYTEIQRAATKAIPWARDPRWPGVYWGRWVGPGPRVVRQLPSSTSDYRTHATWLLYYPNTEWVRERIVWLESTVVEALHNELKATTGSSDWRVPTVAVYDPAINGPVSWWEDGSAQRTRTRDLGDGLIGRVREQPDNPIGPNEFIPDRETLGIGFGGVATVALVGVALVGGAYLLGKVT